MLDTKTYHVFAPMGRFQLELIYLYFPPSSHLVCGYLCCGFHCLKAHYSDVIFEGSILAATIDVGSIVASPLLRVHCCGSTVARSIVAGIIR